MEAHPEWSASAKEACQKKTGLKGGRLVVWISFGLREGGGADPI
ncbi:hypothetical protein [Ekhidna sp.]